jgi:hypothetical protein
MFLWQVAFIGFAVQALVTREQPIEGLVKHLSDPFGHNIISNIGNLPARFPITWTTTMPCCEAQVVRSFHACTCYRSQ